MNSLEQSCHDIITKNMGYTDEKLYLLYDTESPLAQRLSAAYVSMLRRFSGGDIVIREFKNPPQPLYRGGMVNPDNPHIQAQNRIVTTHNIDENLEVGLDHHKIFAVKTATDTSLSTQRGIEGQTLRAGVGQVQDSDTSADIDPQIEDIKDELISLPAGSIVILVQSTNFRLSTFRIRLELFNRGIHVVEHNHLAYIPAEQFDTFENSLVYRTDEYVRLQGEFDKRLSSAENIRVQSVNSKNLVFGSVEKIRGNTGDYSAVANKGGTFPIGEVFTEAKILDSVNGTVLVETYPNEDFSIAVCDPFELTIENGRVLPSPDFPPGFQKLYDWVVQYEGEVMVRELGFGLNPAITTQTPLRDINFHERKLGVHLSLGKKHGIYGKKLPKTEVQRFHIDVFVALEGVSIDEEHIYENGNWII